MQPGREGTMVSKLQFFSFSLPYVYKFAFSWLKILWRGGGIFIGLYEVTVYKFLVNNRVRGTLIHRTLHYPSISLILILCNYKVIGWYFFCNCIKDDNIHKSEAKQIRQSTNALHCQIHFIFCFLKFCSKIILHQN